MTIENSRAITLPNEPGPWSSKYALPANPVEMTITVDMAGDWLDNRFRPGATTHKQRKSQAKGKVAQMAQLMIRNAFPTTHQGMAFDINGWLQDGWHRLTALRLAGQTNQDAVIVVWVHPDQDPNNFDAIDVGTPRRAAQLYQGPHGMLVTSAVRYLTPGTVGRYDRTLTVSEQVRAAERWTELAKWAPDVNSIARRTRVPGAQHLAVMAQAERSDFRDMIPEWIKGVSGGWDLTPGDVRGHIRNRAWREESMNPEDIYGMIAKAWSYYLIGKKVQVFKFAINEDIPAIPGFNGFPRAVLDAIEASNS